MVKVLDDDDDGDQVLRDGESVRVPIFLTDAVTPEFAFDARDHQPGYRPLSYSATAVQDARAAARDAYIKRTSEAWKTAGRDAAEPDMNSPPAVIRRHLAEPDNDDAQKRRDRAYQGYAAALTEAWRNPPGAVPTNAASRIEKARVEQVGK